MLSFGSENNSQVGMQLSPKFNRNVILLLTGLHSGRLAEDILKFEAGGELSDMLRKGRTGAALELLQSLRNWPQGYKNYFFAVISCINAEWQKSVGYFGKVRGVDGGPVAVARLAELCRFFSGKMGLWGKIWGGFNLSELMNCFQYCPAVHAYLLWLKIYRHNESEYKEKSDKAGIEKITETIWTENVLMQHCPQAREFLIKQLASQGKELPEQRTAVLREWLDKAVNSSSGDDFLDGHDLKFWRLLSRVFENNGEYISACRALEVAAGELWSSTDCASLGQLYDLAGDTGKAFMNCRQLAVREKTGREILIKLLFLAEKHLRYLLGENRNNDIRAVYLDLKPLEAAFPLSEWEGFLIRASNLLEKSGSYSEAVVFYEALGRLNPDHPAYLAGIMAFYYRQGEYEQCYRQFSTVLGAGKSLSDYIECVIAAIRSLLGMGKSKEAYQLALKLRKNCSVENVQDVFIETLIPWAEEMFDQDMDECVSLVNDHYLQDGSDRIKQLLMTLRKKRLTIMIRTGEYERADDELISLNRVYPFDREIVLLTSEMEEARGRGEVAISILEEYQLAGFSPETERRLLDLYFAQGWYSKALVTYRNLYGKSQINREDLLYKIHINICRRAFKEANNKREIELLNNALARVTEAIGDFPLDEDIEEFRRRLFIVFGDYYFGEGIYHGAVKYYQKGLPYIKDQNHCIRKLAQCYTNLSHWQEAENYWLKLKDELEPGEIGAYLELINIYLKTQQFDRALLVNEEYYEICGNLNDYSAWNNKIKLATNNQL